MQRRPTTQQTGLPSALATEIRLVTRRLRLRMREHGGGNDLTPSQASVLLCLERDGPSTVSNLARAEGMRPQSMSTIVASLQATGLIGGARDPNDGRQTLMSLTSRCVKWIQGARAAKQDWLTTTIMQRLSAPEQEQLQAALGLLTKLVDD